VVDRELTAFVREVVLPAGPDRVPRISAAHARFRLDARPSPIHGWGVFACEPIPARRRVIEYTGQRITGAEAWRRRLRPQVYTFLLGPDRILDGAVGGSGAEFVNHSCEPNLYARVRSGHIWFVSWRPIAAGEELLLDYQITGTEPVYPCHCGSPHCRGYMNRRLD
jgi:SET domain-containing protein